MSHCAVYPMGRLIDSKWIVQTRSLPVIFRKSNLLLIAVQCVRSRCGYNQKKSTIPPLKGTVSPDNGLYFRFSKFKSVPVPSTGPLIDFTFIYFVVPWYLKFIFKLLLWKYLQITQNLLKAVPESIFRLTDFAVRTLAGSRKPLVSFELGFRKLLCKSKWRVLDSQTWLWKSYQPHERLTERIGFSHP